MISQSIHCLKCSLWQIHGITVIKHFWCIYMFMIRGKENYIHYLIYSWESTVMVFYIALPLIKELTTQENKCRSGPKLMELPGLTISAPHPSPVPWSSWLDGIVEWPFEDSVTLQAWIKFIQMVVHALNQHPIYGTLSPTVRIHGSRNQGVEMGVAQLLYPNDPPAKYFFLFSCPYALSA